MTGARPITSYDVRHSRDGGESWTEVDPATLGARVYAIGGLDNGTSYLVQVRAVSTRSATAVGPIRQRARPKGVPDRPVAPVLTAGDMELVVSWTAPYNGGWPITSYDLRHRVAGSGESAWSDVLSVWTSTMGGDLEHTVGSLDQRRVL